MDTACPLIPCEGYRCHLTFADLLVHWTNDGTNAKVETEAIVSALVERLFSHGCPFEVAIARRTNLEP